MGHPLNQEFGGMFGKHQINVVYVLESVLIRS